MSYQTLKSEQGVPIKAWVKGVPLEDAARKQLLNVSQLPFIFKWVAAMPDVHWGIGATVGSVIPTKGAIIPAAVGVDIGCGMMGDTDRPERARSPRTIFTPCAPSSKTLCRTAARTMVGAVTRVRGVRIPGRNLNVWGNRLKDRYDAILEKHPKLDRGNHSNHLGTLGTGNHFIEVCLDESETVWFMLHSGSRGVGNRMGSYFIELAKKDMGRLVSNLPDKDLAYLQEGTEHFDDYVEAVEWAQDFARTNRDLMMEQIFGAVREPGEVRTFTANVQAINCHHNYVAREVTTGRAFSSREKARCVRKRETWDYSRQHGCSLIHRSRKRQP